MRGLKRKINKPTSGNKIAKVPVVMQMEALECGAASLAMVLAYFGKWIPLEQVRTQCGVSRDGSNAGNILKAARSYGLVAKGYKVEPEQFKTEGTFPCIIHWEFNHFVVLKGIKNNKAYINDPARGNIVIPMETFDESFTGICIFFETGEGFEPSGKKKGAFDFAASRLKGTGVAVAFVIMTSVISSLMGIINPAFSRIFFDRLLTGYNPDWIYPFFLGLAGFGIIQIITAWIQAVYSLKINGKMAIVGSSEYMWKILRMPMEFFSQRMAGDIKQRQEANASIANAIVQTLAPIFMNSVMMIVYAVIMLRYSVILTCIGIASIVIDLWISNIIAKKRVNITRVQMRDAGKLEGTTINGIEMIETIKASGAENGFFMKWAGYQASVNTQQERYERINEYLGVIPTIVNELASIMVLFIGVLFILKGEFTIGMLNAFQAILMSFTAPATENIMAGQTLQEMRAEIERVDDVMNYPIDENCDFENQVETDDYSKLSGCIEMRDITFGYAPLGEPLIENFNMSVKSGQKIAFVGASGCGKSTLSKLLSGLYKPWSGEILFDGKPINEIDRSVFTGSVACVDQDIILFEDTIANNIRMWDSSIEDFEIIMAARDANLHEDIIQREGGYDYVIREGGKDFSGGQRQRMEIARVLAQDPTIIIMDEATSALDAKTEYEVVNAIKARGITCIVVAHRLSTIRDCDEIIVLDKGKVVERGTHEELYAKGGYYTELVSNE